MILVSELQSILDKLHLPVSPLILVRAFLVLLGSLLALAILEWRFKALSGFLNQKSTALNLAVARIAVAATLLWYIRLHDILLNTSLDPALRVPFKIWGRLALRLLVPPAGITVIHVIFAMSAILMLIGLFGRIASAIVALTSVYLISFLFVYGKVDHIYHHLVFFSLVCALFPSTDTLSIDAAWAAWREADAGRLRRTQPALVYGYAMRCMWVFIGVAYFFPGLWKFSRGWRHWFSGKALQDDIAVTGDLLSWTPLQLWVLHHSWLVVLGASLVVLFELGFIFLILFPRLRPWAGFLGLAFHNGSRLVMRISFAPLQSCYFIFFDWTAILSWISRKLSLGRATVRYDPHCKLCRRTAGTLAIFDWTNSLTLVPNPEPLYFSVVTDDGRTGLGYEGYKLIAARVPLLWLVRPFMGLPGIQQLGTAMYTRVAASRVCTVGDRTEAVGENLLTAKAMPFAHSAPIAGIAAMAILGLCHVTDSFPLSCFPTFDGMPSDTLAQLFVQTLDTQNVAQTWNVSADPKLRVVYRHWRWLTLEGINGRIATRAKAAALVNLWLTYHPELHVKNVVVFRDTFQMRPLEGTQVRVSRQKDWEFTF